MVWPPAAISRTISGCSEAGLPIRKKVACTHSWASAARTFLVVGGQGPSSKVSTTSLSCKGKVSGKLFSPTRGNAVASTVMTREVPSASLRGQSVVAASAVPPSAANTNSDATRTRQFKAQILLLPIGRFIVNRTLIGFTDDAFSGRGRQIRVLFGG